MCRVFKASWLMSKVLRNTVRLGRDLCRVFGEQDWKLLGYLITLVISLVENRSPYFPRTVKRKKPITYERCDTGSSTSIPPRQALASVLTVQVFRTG